MSRQLGMRRFRGGRDDLTEMGFAGNLHDLFKPIAFAAVVAGAGIAWTATWNCYSYRCRVANGPTAGCQ